MSTYEAPALNVIGTVHDVTQQHFNKCGLTPDFITHIHGVVGDHVPSPHGCEAPVAHER